MPQLSRSNGVIVMCVQCGIQRRWSSSWRRCTTFLEWDRDRWNKCALHIRQRPDGASHFPTTLPPHETLFSEGLKAYALRQASVRQHLFNTFVQQWHDVPTFVAIADCGLADEEVMVDTSV
jgi:hypothetical protein